MPKNLLFIEDDEDFSELVTAYLRGRGFTVTSISSGREGLRELGKDSYDLVILDLGLPDEDGLSLCKKIRRKEGVPILILTARDDVSDKVAGLDVGADDYLVKPVSLRELKARIERLIGRELKDAFRSSVFQFGEVEFDTASGRLASKGKSAMLTKKEKAVLEYLLLRKDQVLTRMEIMDHVWGEDIDPFSNIVNMVISSLRKKLRQLSKEKLIHSVHGLGYKFEIKEDE